MSNFFKIVTRKMSKCTNINHFEEVLIKHLLKNYPYVKYFIEMDWW